MPSVDMLGRW